MVSMANVLLPLHLSIANISNHFQNTLGYMPLQQACAYQSHFIANVLHFIESILWDNKAANTGIKQLHFINMPKYTYRNISNTFFPAFLAFGSISKHFHCTKS